MRYQRLSYGYALIVHAPTTAWKPAVDVYETPTAIHVTVEVPGVDPEAVEVLLFENALVVQGLRELPAALDGGGFYHSAEIRRGPFRVEIALASPVQTQPAEMRCERGILSIGLPKEVRNGNG